MEWNKFMNHLSKSIKCLFLIFFLLIIQSNIGAQDLKQNSRSLLMDSKWRFHLGDVHGADNPEFDDNDWRMLNVPHDYSIEGEFSAQNASGTGYLPGGIGSAQFHRCYRSQ